MAKFDKIAVLKKIGDTGMVPVFYHKDLETCKNVVKACYEGGVRAFEFTNRGDFAQEIFGELVKWADKECPELALGIGSIVDAPTAAMYIQLGACFVVGPLLNPDIAPVWSPQHRRDRWPPYGATHAFIPHEQWVHGDDQICHGIFP